MDDTRNLSPRLAHEESGGAAAATDEKEEEKAAEIRGLASCMLLWKFA